MRCAACVCELATTSRPRSPDKAGAEGPERQQGLLLSVAAAACSPQSSSQKCSSPSSPSPRAPASTTSPSRSTQRWCSRASRSPTGRPSPPGCARVPTMCRRGSTGCAGRCPRTPTRWPSSTRQRRRAEVPAWPAPMAATAADETSARQRRASTTARCSSRRGRRLAARRPRSPRRASMVSR